MTRLLITNFYFHQPIDSDRGDLDPDRSNSRSAAKPSLSPMTHDPSSFSRQVEITNALGLHLRTAAKFEESARRFRADVRVFFNGCEYNGKSIMSLLTMAAEKGAIITIEAKGDDARDAVDVLAELVLAKFYEIDEELGAEESAP